MHKHSDAEHYLTRQATDRGLHPKAQMHNRIVVGGAVEGAEVLPKISDSALVVFNWGDGEEVVDGGAAGEDALGAFADYGPDFGVGILLSRSNECGCENEGVTNVLELNEKEFEWLFAGLGWEGHGPGLKYLSTREILHVHQADHCLGGIDNDNFINPIFFEHMHGLCGELVALDGDRVGGHMILDAVVSNITVFLIGADKVAVREDARNGPAHQ